MGTPPTTDAEPGDAKGSMRGELKKVESDGTTASTGVPGVYIEVVAFDSVLLIDPDDIVLPGVGEVFLVCLGRRGSGAWPCVNPGWDRIWFCA